VSGPSPSGRCTIVVAPADHGSTEQPDRLSRMQFSRWTSPASHATDALSTTAQMTAASLTARGVR
jgi:hypothetical protein